MTVRPGELGSLNARLPALAALWPPSRLTSVVCTSRVPQDNQPFVYYRPPLFVVPGAEKMGSFRSRRGGRSGRGGGAGPARGQKRRRKGGDGDASGGAGDFRWKKAKKGKRHDAEAADTPAANAFVESGDALTEGDFVPAADDANAPDHVGAAQQSNAASDGPAAKKSKIGSQKRREKRVHLEAKRKRRLMHDQQRLQSDAMLRTSPGRFLWERYAQWAGDKLTSIEKKAEQWDADQVCSVEELEDVKLIDQIKEVVGADYVAQGNWKKKSSATPGIACIVLTPSAVRAAHLATNVYDGKPVGKLFGKHIKISEQKEWVKRCCSQGLAPSGAGTAKRVQRLIEDGDITLKHTSALVIDFSRDVRLRNILDINSTRDELFDFLHTQARERIAEAKMKVVLYVPPEKKDLPVEEAEGEQEVYSKGTDQEESE